MTHARIFDDGSFDILFKKDSYIINNHRQGGQSSQRFERIRQNQIKSWFKDFNEILTDMDAKIVLGTHKFYENTIFEQLSPENKTKIVSVFSTEFADESGVYQYLNKQKAYK